MNAETKRSPGFAYSPMFPLGEDGTTWRKLDIKGISTLEVDGKTVLRVSADALSELAFEAFKDVSHLLRPAHLGQLSKILKDPEASENDRYVAREFLKNANIAAAGVLPMCQDTGTALVFGKKGQRVWVEGDEEEAISWGVHRTFTERNLRYSQMAPISMYEEKNTGNNLPVQFDILAAPGDHHAEEFSLMFIAKGGGSANKTFLYQETRAVLTPEKLLAFIEAKTKTLGTSACPPYHLSIVVGGTSAELTLKTVKLGSTKYLDNLPTEGGPTGHAFRDLELEQRVLEMTQKIGIGAQFGGKYFCHDVRVIRLPRHGASFPIGIGVSCSADRQIKAKITKDGVFLEQLETDPAKYLPEVTEEHLGAEVVAIDLARPMAEIRAELSKHPIKTRVALTGTIVVARDIAHAELKKRLDRGEGLPEYLKNHPVYYAGPAKTPEGMPTGSFGPTTAGRMDSYVEEFQAAGGSLVMLAKGNRSKAVRDACKAHGGFYLGSIGGPAAVLAEQNITKVEVLEYPELGMEAVWKIEVKDFPAFIVVDDKGNDFFRRARLMKFTVDRIDHIVMTCSDLSVTAGWYQRVLGMEREEYGGKNRTALRFGAQKINLHEVGHEVLPHAQAAQPGTLDLCFVVAVRPEDVVAQLHACGVSIERGPVTRIGALGDIMSVYCRDPDGNLIELASYMGE